MTIMPLASDPHEHLLDGYFKYISLMGIRKLDSNILRKHGAGVNLKNGPLGPDFCWKHKHSVHPVLVLEIAYTQPLDKALKKGHRYILESNGQVKTVIIVNVPIGKKKNESGSVSILCATWDPVLKTVKVSATTNVSSASLHERKKRGRSFPPN